MSKHPKQTCKLWGIIPLKHTYLITNAFTTLDSSDVWDVIKSCQRCGKKEALSVTQELLLETVYKFPNAYLPILREYLESLK